MTRSWFAVALVGALALSSAGCATLAGRRPTRPVSIDDRPTPPQGDTTGVHHPTIESGTRTSRAGEVKVEGAMSPEERQQLLARVVADTTDAGAAARRCRTQRLLPDQENVVEATLGLLSEARQALLRDELWRAESLARKAKQLASSLNCP